MIQKNLTKTEGYKNFSVHAKYLLNQFWGGQNKNEKIYLHRNSDILEYPLASQVNIKLIL